jgi:hypothetical protein
MSTKRKQLLVELESIVGNSFYNAHIQNHGPGSIREGDGRGLRYPVTFLDKDGTKVKCKEPVILDKFIPEGGLMTGHYAVGANRLDIMDALHHVLHHLESRYGFSVDRSQTANGKPDESA